MSQLNKVLSPSAMQQQQQQQHDQFIDTKQWNDHYIFPRQPSQENYQSTNESDKVTNSSYDNLFHSSNNPSVKLEHSQHVRQRLLESAWLGPGHQLPQLSHFSSRTSSATDHTPSNVRSPSYTSGSNTPTDTSTINTTINQSINTDDHLCMPDSALQQQEDDAQNGIFEPVHSFPSYQMNQSSNNQTMNSFQNTSTNEPMNLTQSMNQSMNQTMNRWQRLLPSANELSSASTNQQNNQSTEKPHIATCSLAQRILAPPAGFDDYTWSQLILTSPVTVDLLSCLFLDQNRVFESNLEYWGNDFIERARLEVVTHVSTNKRIEPAIHAVEAVKHEVAMQGKRNYQQGLDFQRCTSEVGTQRWLNNPSIDQSSNQQCPFASSSHDNASNSAPSQIQNQLNTQTVNQTINQLFPSGIPTLPEQLPFSHHHHTFYNRQRSAPSALAESPDLSGNVTRMQLNRDYQTVRSDSPYLGMHAATRGTMFPPGQSIHQSINQSTDSYDSSKRRRRRSEELAETERWKCSNTGCWRFYRKSSTASIRTHQQSCSHRDMSQQTNQSTNQSTDETKTVPVAQQNDSPVRPARSPPPPLETLQEDAELVIFRDE